MTPKRQAFVAAYLSNGEDATAAYRAAYATHTTPQATRVEASRLMKEPLIAAAIAQARAKADARQQAVMERYAVTKERVIEALAKIAFADVGDVAKWEDGKLVIANSDQITPDQRFAIQEVSQTDGRLRLKMADKRAALVDLGKHLNLFVEQTQALGPDGKPLASTGQQTFILKVER